VTVPEPPATGLSLAAVFLEPFMKLAAVQPGERVIDIACGTGEQTIAAALRAGPQGEVLAIDRDPYLLTDLSARALEAGIHSLRTAIMDASHLDLPDSYWDVALCHLGLSELDDPEAAVREVVSVLRPVGRLTISTYGERERSPLLSMFLDAVGTFLPAQTAAVARSLFHYAEAGRLARLLAEQGFEDAVPERVTEWVHFTDVEQYWQALGATRQLAPLAVQLSPEQAQRCRAELERRTRFYRRAGGIELKVEAVILAAVK
jgi:ubiquinone/menaquinone biosynthesis C-methylase UbiE